MAKFDRSSVKIRRMTPEAIARELAAFERYYAITSDEFYEQFNRGALPHSDDFFLWAALYDMGYRAGIVHKAGDNIEELLKAQFEGPHVCGEDLNDPRNKGAEAR